MSDQFDEQAAELIGMYLGEPAEYPSTTAAVARALRATAAAARREAVEECIAACASMRTHLKEQSGAEPGFGREYSFQIRGVQAVQERLRMMLGTPSPTDLAALKEDQVIADYFGVTIEEVRKVKAAAQQKDPTP